MSERDWTFGDPDTEVDVLVEPVEGHTAEEVAELLRAGGAALVEVPAPGFVSARAPRRVLDTLAGVAVVHPKPTKRMHRPR